MKAISVSDRSRILGLNTIGFLVVALAAYFSAVITMGYAMNRISTVKAAVLIGLAVTYLVNGVYGYAWARNAESIRLSIILRRNSNRHRHGRTLPG